GRPLTTVDRPTPCWEAAPQMACQGAVLPLLRQCSAPSQHGRGPQRLTAPSAMRHARSADGARWSLTYIDRAHARSGACLDENLTVQLGDDPGTRIRCTRCACP